jgi:hypothetical protein
MSYLHRGGSLKLRIQSRMEGKLCPPRTSAPGTGKDGNFDVTTDYSYKAYSVYMSIYTNIQSENTTILNRL